MKRLLCLLCLLPGMGGTASLASEPQEITGCVVTDADNEPLPGALVQALRYGTEAVTDPAGRYAIRAHACDTLVFHFVTLEDRRIPVAGRTRIDVRMQGEEVDIEKIVVNTGVKPRKR